MLGPLLNVFKVPDLRRKLAITLGLILVYRIGAHIPCPLVDLEALGNFARGGGMGGMFGMVDMFTGGAFRNMTIFALGIMPYITASIILQLLTAVWPYLEKIAKEGEAGRKKINQYTRYGTVVLAAFQSMGLAIYMMQSGLALVDNPVFFIITTMIAMTTGTCFIMWLGEKITEFGIGNGISLIIAAGIISDYRNSFAIGIFDAKNERMPLIWLALIPLIYVAITALIIVMQQANRRIPIQYARRVVGRREMMGSSNALPLKINTAGVIPPIFASSILMFPSFFFRILSPNPEGMLSGVERFFQPYTTQNLYNLFDISSGGIMNLLKIGNAYNFLYSAMIVFFCYFYTAITFNPVDTADNLKRVGALIPGRLPGKSTSDYIDYVLTRITLVGAIFLVFVSILPNVLYEAFNVNYSFADMVGGTGLIIVAGVFLDLKNQIESQLLMRHYEGFKYRSRGSSMRLSTRGMGTSGGGGTAGPRSGRR